MNIRLIAVLSLLCLPSTVWAKTIHGKVYLSEELTPNVVVVVTRSEGMPLRSLVTVHLDHAEGKFTPHVLPIEVGTTVEFRSTDGMPCRLYSASETTTFNLTRQSGPNRSLTFDRPGAVVVRCQDHPKALAFIVVTETPYFTVTGEAGQYSIEGIPEGEQTVQLWFEGRVLKEKTVTSREEDVFLDFHIERPRNASPSIPGGAVKTEDFQKQ